MKWETPGVGLVTVWAWAERRPVGQSVGDGSDGVSVEGMIPQERGSSAPPLIVTVLWYSSS